MSDNGNGENEGMVHENKVAEWPDDIKAKIARQKNVLRPSKRKWVAQIPTWWYMELS